MQITKREINSTFFVHHSAELGLAEKEAQDNAKLDDEFAPFGSLKHICKDCGKLSYSPFHPQCNECFMGVGASFVLVPMEAPVYVESADYTKLTEEEELISAIHYAEMDKLADKAEEAYVEAKASIFDDIEF